VINVEWDNYEKTIIIWTFSSPWTWVEFWDTKNEVHAMIESVSHFVDIIVLTSVEQNLPPNAISNIRGIFRNRHERGGLMVVVGAKKFLSIIVNLIVKFLPNADAQLQFADTREKAYDLIAEIKARRLEVVS
jgi:hypothetical protein